MYLFYEFECFILVRGKSIRARSSIHRAWYGGFVGEFEVTIENPATSWEAVLKFPRKVHDLKVSHKLLAIVSAQTDLATLHFDSMFALRK